MPRLLLLMYQGGSPPDLVYTSLAALDVKAAAISTALGLRGNDLATVAAAQNKWQQRIRLSAAGVPGPRFAPIHHVGDLAGAAAAVGFPAVLKPAYGAASEYVFAVNDVAELEQCYGQVIQGYRNRLHQAGGTVFLLEQRLQGENWNADSRIGDFASVESLVVDGVVQHLVITDRLPLIAPFRETGLMLPSGLPIERQAALYNTATAAIKALVHCYSSNDG